MKKFLPYVFVTVLFLIGCFVIVTGEKPVNKEELPGQPPGENVEKIESAGKSDDSDIVLRKVDGTIKRVIDGDTIVVNFGVEKEERIRLLLIDTPESVHPEKGTEPFGQDASDYAKKYLKRGKKVTVEIGNPERDEHGRLLAYIWADGHNFNKHMIDKGFARVAYVNPPNIKYLEEFQQAEEIAKLNGANIWSIEGYVTEDGFDSSVVPKESGRSVFD